MHVRLQIPALDEAATIQGVVRGALAAAEEVAGRHGRVSALVVDDGSRDGTAALVAALARRDRRIEVLHHPRTEGLGRSFRQGVALARAADADVLVHLDGDGQFDPADIPRLAAPVLAGADAAVGSRFADPALSPRMPRVRRLGNAVVASLVSALSGRRLFDASCGFRAFSRRALAELELFGDFTYTHESLLVCAHRGLSVVEVPLRVRGEREHGRSRLAPSSLVYGLRAGGIILATYVRLRREAA